MYGHEGIVVNMEVLKTQTCPTRAARHSGKSSGGRLVPCPSCYYFYAFDNLEYCSGSAFMRGVIVATFVRYLEETSGRSKYRLGANQTRVLEYYTNLSRLVFVRDEISGKRMHHCSGHSGPTKLKLIYTRPKYEYFVVQQRKVCEQPRSTDGFKFCLFNVPGLIIAFCRSCVTRQPAFPRIRKHAAHVIVTRTIHLSI